MVISTPDSGDKSPCGHSASSAEFCSAYLTLAPPYTRGFGILKDEIDTAAPHDMISIRANIAKWRMSLRPDAQGALREGGKDMGRGATSEMV